MIKEIEIFGINKYFDENGKFNRLFISFRFKSSLTDAIGMSELDVTRDDSNENLFALNEDEKIANAQDVLDAVKEKATAFHDKEWLARVLPPKEAAKVLPKVETDPIIQELGTKVIEVTA